jgi:hydroxypyruvate isomerase
MPRLAANLTMMFNEVGFLDRFQSAAAAGFTGVEYLFPYEHDAGLLKDILARFGLTQVLYNLPGGRWADGDRGIGCLPDRVDEFKSGVATAIEYATTLGCTQINCLAGIRPPSLSATIARDTLVANLRYAAPRLEAAGIRLLLEAINTRDIPGFFVSHTSQALDIIDAVQSDNVFLQYDVYHMQIMEGDLAPTIERHLTRIAHIQVADTPGRHEPGTGEINYDFLLAFIDRVGYAGWIGCEYKPTATTAAGLGWTRPYLTRE